VQFCKYVPLILYYISRALSYAFWVNRQVAESDY